MKLRVLLDEIESRDGKELVKILNRYAHTEGPFGSLFDTIEVAVDPTSKLFKKIKKLANNSHWYVSKTLYGTEQVILKKEVVPASTKKLKYAYHVSPASVREKIQKHGLILRSGGKTDKYKNRLYLFTRKADAKALSAELRRYIHEDIYDLWEINMSQIKAEIYQDTTSSYEAYYIRKAIPFSKIKHIKQIKFSIVENEE